MKLMIIVDIDDEWLDRINTTYDEMFADITIYKKESLEKQCDYSQRLYRCWYPLKPLPKYKEDIVERNIKTAQRASDFLMLKCFDDGYNACLDEILGEK